MIYTRFLAVIPFYNEYGQNATCVLFKDGSREYLNCSIKNYIHTMFSKLHLDPKALSFWTYGILGYKLNAPLIIDEDTVLIPIKFRKSISKHDGCFGYVHQRFIKDVQDYSLTLSTEEVLDTLTLASYVAKKQKDATFLTYAYLDYKKQFEFMWKV